MKFYKIFSIAILLAWCAVSIDAQEVSFDENKYYRLTNMWMGEGKSIDVTSKGQIQMAATGNYSGQLWKITSQGNGTFKLSCQWKGEGRVMDVINDGKNNRVALADNARYSGQFWTIKPLGDGYYRLINGWQTNKSLDCDGDKKSSNAWLNPTGNYSGQYWKITDTSAPSSAIAGATKVKVGDKAHGGIVFQVDESGMHGLVCQEEDLTKLMSFSEAKNACEKSKVGKKTDWRLPTMDELELIYTNLRKSGLHHFHQEWYWSSEVKDKHNMWSLDVLHGTRFPHWENDHSHVRAVRAF